jgi:hypothetical protein
MTTANLTLYAVEVLHVERPALCLGALVGEYDFVALEAAGLECLRVVSAAVELVVRRKVNVVHQQLTTHRTHKTARVEDLRGEARR